MSLRTSFVKLIQNNARYITTGCPQLKEVNIKLKGRKKSSQEWLTRQLTDPYVEQTKRLNYRCRSAFKLIEIDDQYKILKPGQCVIDCGAAPGSWTQVAVNRCNSDKHDESEPTGVVISVDLSPIHPLEGAILLSGIDITLPKSQDIMRKALNGRLLDVVLSDMAPRASGVRQLDNDKMLELIYSVMKFSLPLSQVGGTLLVKLWNCGEREKLESEMRRFYESVKVCKPNASRADSAEIYLLARNFKGLKKTDI